MEQTRCHGRFLTEVTRQIDQGDTGFGLDDGLDNLAGLVTATIVDEHNLQLVTQRLQLLVDGIDKGLDALLFVVDRDNQRNGEIFFLFHD